MAGRTEKLLDFLIPTIGEFLPIETIPIDRYGAKGAGDPVLIVTARRVLAAGGRS